MSSSELSEFSEKTKQSLFEERPEIVEVYDFEPSPKSEEIFKNLVDLPKKEFFEVAEISQLVKLLCESYRRTYQSESESSEFDIALAPKAKSAVYQLTGTDAIFSQTYGSPEQALGVEKDEKQDVYLIGALIYDLLTGRPPFYRGDVLRQIQMITPPTMTERRRELGLRGELIPQRWETLVAACLSKHPEDRPGFAELINRLLGKAGPIHPRKTKKKKKQKSSVFPKIAVALIFTSLLAGAGAAAVHLRKTKTETEKAGVVVDKETKTMPITLPSTTTSSPTAPTAPDLELAMIPDPKPVLGHEQEIIEESVPELPPKQAAEVAMLRLPTVGVTKNPLGVLFPESLTRKLKPAKALEQKPPKKGESFLLEDIGMEMIWITVLQSWVAKSEVTAEQYTKGGGTGFKKFEGDKIARDSISWNQAMEYCDNLNQSEYEKGRLPKGYIYTLPTENQWMIFVGDASLSHSVYNRSSSYGPSEPGTRRENQYGLVDVRGNLWEWLLDDHTPSNPSRGKVLRGGSYASNSKLVMDKNSRYYGAKDLSYFIYGFRFILTRMEE